MPITSTEMLPNLRHCCCPMWVHYRTSNAPLSESTSGMAALWLLRVQQVSMTNGEIPAKILLWQIYSVRTRPIQTSAGSTPDNLSILIFDSHRNCAKRFGDLTLKKSQHLQ